jgi:hypothetical protein
LGFALGQPCRGPAALLSPAETAITPPAPAGLQIGKADLPSKTCVVCGLPFTWRKKWEKVVE